MENDVEAKSLDKNFLFTGLITPTVPLVPRPTTTSFTSAIRSQKAHQHPLQLIVTKVSYQ
jgi:hypothetical protein